MKIEYLLHAENQLKERQISKKLIEKILSKPDQVVDARFNRKIAQKVMLEGKFKFLYRVIYIVSESKTVVITAYKTRNIKKYWVEK